MKATEFEFRYRFAIVVMIYVLGFVAPWDYAWHLDGGGPNAHVWGQLAAALSKSGAMSIGAAFNVLLVVGIVCAATGAWLRTWGSAYLGTDVMRDMNLRGDAVVADGPYRYMRNPLYVGAWLNALALALLMPPTGAVFAVTALVAFQIRLILDEETFLTKTQGEAYAAYCARVPRILPALRARVAASSARPRWGEAALAEIMMWGVAGSFAVLGWRYNALLLIQCVLVSLGAALIVRAFAKPGPQVQS